MKFIPKISIVACVLLLGCKPLSVRENESLNAFVHRYPGASSFTALMDKLNYWEEIKYREPYTLLVPLNDSEPTINWEILNHPDQLDATADWLGGWVIRDSIGVNSLRQLSKVPTLSQSDVIVGGEGKHITLNGRKVVSYFALKEGWVYFLE